MISYSKLLFFIFILFFLIILPFSLDLEFNFVGFTFFANILLILFFLFISIRKNISSFLFIFIFILIFLVIVPWVHYSNHILLWSNNFFNDYDYVFLNIVLSIIIVIFSLFYRVFDFSKSYKSKDFIVSLNKNENFFLKIIISSFCFVLIFYLKNFDLTRIFFKGVEVDYEIYNTPILSFIEIFIRLIPLFIFIKFVTLKKESRLFKEFLLLTLVVLCAFPLALSRFAVAYVYFPVLYYYFIFLRKSYLTFLVLLFSILIIFPFLEQFRYYDTDTKIKLLPDINFFNEAHFDAYQNFMEVIRVDFISYGYQLLGSLLFFIPRFVWPTKPVGSGYQMAEDLNYSFNNISMPYFAEGYVNFGFIGVLLFVIILSFLSRYIDDVLLNYHNSVCNNYKFFIGVFYCAAIFFVMRGDLMSTFTYTIAGILAYKIAEKI